MDLASVIIESICLVLANGIVILLLLENPVG